jgi:two-component system, OmpR family, sensor kinase
MTTRNSGRSILNQTFWLVVGSLIVIDAISLASLFLLPRPRQEGVSLMQLVERIQHDGQSAPRRRRLADIPVTQAAAPPTPAPGFATNAQLSREFAERMDLKPDQVRVYFRPDYNAPSRNGSRVNTDGIVRWLGEPFFYDSAVVAAKTGTSWRIIQTPDRPLIADWQKRMAIVFGLALLSLLPLVFLYARQMVKPIRAFADAADRVGRDADAPMVQEDGPAELRIAARAVNAMQGRIAAQIKEREAMVAAIAHDLRTPLSRIAFRIESADDALREPIQRDIDQMKSMISATLNFVRGSSREMPLEPVALDRLVDEIVGSEAHVGRPVEWQSKPEGAFTVRGDPIALGRMIQNLVDNAIAYGRRADLSLGRVEGRARIVIADRGPGLPADEVEAMFAPFARKERSRNRETGGVGLGLAIARAIAQDHGGEIALGPRTGGGMEAVVMLPLAS